MTTKERLEAALNCMNKRRDALLDEYLASMEKPEWTPEVSLNAINTAGRLYDCDRHVTNLTMELKRIQTSGGNGKGNGNAS